MIPSEVAESIENCVLCWLATVSEDGTPNVSPKEAFLHDGEGRILVANIASPVTVRNIKQNERVCISFVNIFIQKGYKIAGNATVLEPGDTGYEARHERLTSLIGSAFPIVSIIEIDPVETDEIIAPSYRLLPETGPRERIRESLETYQVDEYKKLVRHGSSESPAAPVNQ